LKSFFVWQLWVDFYDEILCVGRFRENFCRNFSAGNFLDFLVLKIIYNFDCLKFFNFINCIEQIVIYTCVFLNLK
jgi:hypothetical protein